MNLSPLFRDLFQAFPHLQPIASNPEEAARFCLALNVLHPHGVVLGGVYQHFKGHQYRVTGICQDADDWNGERLVEYVELNNAEHKAVRKVSHFLAYENRDEYTGPKFRLVRVS